MSDQHTTVDITKIDAERGFFDEFKKPSKDEWKEEATAALKGAPFDKVMYTKTYEGLTIEPIYQAEDIKGLPHLGSKPGFQPFVRSTRPNGYIKAPWKISQEITQAFPQEFNEEARFDIARGQTGLNIVLDYPTRIGQSPANAPEEEVGRDGVSLETLHDVSTLFQGIDLKTISVQCFTGAISLPMLAMLSVAMQDNEAGVNRLYWVDGCVGSDPLAVLATEGKLPVSLKMAYDSMHQAAVWASKKAPKLQTIFVQGHPYHNAGAASTEEVAFALATAAEYLREMIQRGMSIDEIAPRIRFGFSLGSTFFMEIAKLRSARILWAQIVAAFGGSEEAQKMTIHGRTSAYNKTVFDPLRQHAARHQRRLFRRRGRRGQHAPVAIRRADPHAGPLLAAHRAQRADHVAGRIALHHADRSGRRLLLHRETDARIRRIGLEDLPGNREKRRHVRRDPGRHTAEDGRRNRSKTRQGGRNAQRRHSRHQHVCQSGREKNRSAARR